MTKQEQNCDQTKKKREKEKLQKKCINYLNKLFIVAVTLEERNTN